MIPIATSNQRICFPGGEAELRYTLFQSAQTNEPLSYGISVQNQTTGEQAKVRSLTTDFFLAEMLYQKLLRNQVTPVTLRDIAEDFLAEI